MQTRHATVGLGSWLIGAALAASGCSAGERQPAPGAAISAPQATAGAARPIVTRGSRATTQSSAKPGELIVKYKSEGALAVTECVERWLSERRSFKSATGDHSTSLDELHRAIGVQGAHALLPGRRGLATGLARQRLGATTLNALRLGKRANAARPARSFAELANLYVLELPQSADLEAAARELAADPHVAYAQPNYRMHTHFAPDDPYLASSGSWGQAEDDLWGLKRSQFPAAWELAQGEGVVVAVVDSGLDLEHPELAANVWHNASEVADNGLDDDGNGFVDDVHGWNFGLNTNDPTDEYGHGTLVAGVIAAIGNNGVGVIGSAPRAKILPVNAMPDGGAESATLAQAILYAAQNGARVINNSWGCNSECPENPAVEDAVDIAYALGVTVVFAAGNTGEDIRRYSPQNHPNVIVVGASDPNDQPAFFSNFGLLDVTAPGSGTLDGLPEYEAYRNILSLKAARCSLDVCPPELVVADGYVRQAGTSLAAPQVAGLAALVLARYPEYTPEQVRQVIHRGSVDAAAPGYDLETGHGRIDAVRTLSEPEPLEASIAGPLRDLRTRALVPVTGTAKGVGFASYRVELASSADPTNYALLASGVTAVHDGVLATLDASRIADGAYALRLQATNAAGVVYEDHQSIALKRVFISAPASSEFEPNYPFFRAGSLIEVRGSAGPGDFRSYALDILHSDGSPLEGASVNLPNGGDLPVDAGLLGTWDTRGVPADAYNVVLRVVGAADEPTTVSILVVVDPTLQAGWPIELPRLLDAVGDTRVVQDQLTAADLDGDGASELAVGYGTGVRLLTHSGVDLPGWPQTVDPSGLGHFVLRAPAVADVTGDAVPEVIAANDAGELFVWARDGRLLVAAAEADATFIAVDDLDGDGVNDIVTTNFSGRLAVSRVEDSEFVTWFEQSFPATPRLSPPALGDVDGDGTLEVALTGTDPLIGEGVTQLYLVGRDGVLPGWPQLINDGEPEQPDSTNTFTTIYPSYPVLGDLDADGDLEVVITGDSGAVSVLRYDGTALPGWPQATKPTPLNSPTLADFDGDGTLDVLAGTSSRFDFDTRPFFQSFLYAFTHRGVVFPNFPIAAPDASFIHFGYGAVALADIDGDDHVDAIVSSDGDYDRPRLVNAFSSSASMLRDFPKFTNYIGGYPTNTAAVADFDGDRKLELAFVDYSRRIYLWDLDAPASARRPWPMFQHDAQHTARADAVRVVPPPPIAAFRVRARNAGNPYDRRINPELRLLNDGTQPVPLQEFTVRYWYTNETAPSPQRFELRSAQNQAYRTPIPRRRIRSRFVRVHRPGADRYLEIGFAAHAGRLAAKSGVALKFEIHARNADHYRETNDYSYTASPREIDWSRVTLYRNGVLVWGVEP